MFVWKRACSTRPLSKRPSRFWNDSHLYVQQTFPNDVDCWDGHWPEGTDLIYTCGILGSQDCTKGQKISKANYFVLIPIKKLTKCSAQRAKPGQN